MSIPTSQDCCESSQYWRQKASDRHPGILPLSLCWGKFKSQKRADPKSDRAPARGAGPRALGSRRGGVTRGDAGRHTVLPRPPARLERRRPGPQPAPAGGAGGESARGGARARGLAHFFGERAVAPAPRGGAGGPGSLGAGRVTAHSPRLRFPRLRLTVRLSGGRWLRGAGRCPLPGLRRDSNVSH